MGHIVPALRFAPLVPPWVLALLGALALVALGLALFRRARGALLRAGFALVVLGWLAGPLLVRETWRALPDIGLLVLDHSASKFTSRKTRPSGCDRPSHRPLRRPRLVA